MIKTINRVCAAAILAVTAYGVYGGVTLQERFTHLVERQTQIRGLQDRWLDLKWDNTIDGVLAEEENKIREKKKVFEEKDEGLRVSQETLRESRADYSRDPDLEKMVVYESDVMRGMVRKDAAQIERLRIVMEEIKRDYPGQLERLQVARTALDVVYGVRKARRIEEMNAAAQKRTEEERMSVQKKKDEEERMIKYYTELYTRTSIGGDHPLVAYEKLNEAMRKNDIETIIGLQSLGKDRPYVDVAWLERFLTIVGRTDSKIQDGLPPGASWGSADHVGMLDRASGRWEQDSNEEYVLARVGEVCREKYSFNWRFNPSQEKVNEEKRLYGKQRTTGQVGFLAFWRINDGTWRIGQCGRYDLIVK